MSKETVNILKKSIKIAGVACIALGGAALIASGAALKAVTEGAKYLKDSIRKIVDEEPKAEKPAVEVTAQKVTEALLPELWQMQRILLRRKRRKPDL